MAELLQLRGVTHHAGPRVLFEDVDLVLSTGMRLGLVGPNGAGKSTLLRILAGEIGADGGELQLSRGLRVALVRQTPEFDPEQTVADHLRRRMERAPGPPPGVDAEVSLRRTLGRAGFDDPQRKLGELSGGWRRRAAIAAELALQPDLLLLDEPTNHLDLEGILWLEELLPAARFACVVVSHDRRFLEAVTTHMAEVDPRFPGGFYLSKGNYSQFLEERESFFQRMEGREQSLAAQVREEIRYLRQGPKARRSKSASRVARAHDTIDELERVQRLNRTGEVSGAFAETGRRTKRLVVAEGASVNRGEHACFRDLDLVLGPGRRIGLVGPNGSGKSTLLRTLLGEIDIGAGRLEFAPQLRVVYFDQEREQLDENATLGETLSPEGDHLVVGARRMHVKSWARQLLFRDDQIPQPVRSLSGGERARLLIGRLMTRQADLLLLDEPTNDLDIGTIEMLERSLLEFEGAVVIVTHDRFLMDRVATSLLALDGQGGWRELADLAQWEEMRDAEARPQEPTSPKPKRPAPPPSKPTKMSYKDKREYEQMEERILEAESELDACKQAIASPAAMGDASRLRELSEKLQSAQSRVDALYARWSELEAIARGHGG